VIRYTLQSPAALVQSIASRSKPATYAHPSPRSTGPDGAGDTLYGVEPLSYYLVNLFLNLNLSILLAALLPFLALKVT
jgi:hypothetical protein